MKPVKTTPVTEDNPNTHAGKRADVECTSEQSCKLQNQIFVSDVFDTSLISISCSDQTRASNLDLEKHKKVSLSNNKRDNRYLNFFLLSTNLIFRQHRFSYLTPWVEITALHNHEPIPT